MKAALCMTLASLVLAVRKDSLHQGTKAFDGNHHLTWGDPLGETIGFEMELVFGPIVNTFLFPPMVEKAVHEVQQGLDKEGLQATVRTNACKCTRYVSGKGYVLPLLFEVKGIKDFDVFNAKSLTKMVKAATLHLALNGQPGPGGVGYAKDGEPVEMQLRHHPEVGDALKSFSLLDAGGAQTTLAVEFWQQKLAAHEGAASNAALLEKMWDKITGLYWQKLYDGGIDAVISGIEHAQDSHPRSYAEVKELFDKGRAACVQAPDFQALASQDNGQVSLWQGTADGQEFLGFRAAITLLSVNANINERKKLPDIRNDIMNALVSPQGEDLAGKLQAYREESNAIPCGWMPNEPDAPPFPHDSEPCREPPTF